MPIPGGSTYAPEADNLLSLWGSSASNVWAGGGSGTLIHWTGDRWSSVTTGSTLYVYGLWGASPADVWGVGNGGNRLHWDGAALEKSSEGYTSFNTIAGRARDDVWGVGSCCWDKPGQESGWASHYDGTTWTSKAFPGVAALFDVWVSPSGTFYSLAMDNKLRRLR